MAETQNLAINVTADIQQALSNIETITNRINILGSVVQKTFEIMKTSFEKFVNVGHEFNKNMETNLIAFEVLLKSEDKAIKLMDKLNIIASKTPFQLPQLTNMTKGLLSANIQLEAMPYFLTAIGNASASTDNMAESASRLTRAIRQMLGKGKILSEEMEQIAETGVQPWAILSKETGKSIAELRKLSEKGMLDVYETIEALMDGFNKEFPGMMDKMSKTWDGLMSTIKDNLSQFSGLIQEAYQNKFKKYLAVVADNLVYLVQLLKATNDPILAIQATLEKAFGKDVMEGIIPSIFLLVALFESLKNSIIAVFKSIAPVIIALLQKISPVILFIASLVTVLGEKFASLPPFIHILVVLGGLLFSVFVSLLPIFVTIGTLIAGLVSAIMAFGTEILITIGIIAGLGVYIVAVIGYLVSFGIALYQAWKSSETFRNIVIQSFSEIWENIKVIVGNIIEYVIAMGNVWIGIFKAVFPYIVAIVAIAFTEILKSINKFIAILRGLTDILTGIFTLNWGKVWNGVKVIFVAVFNDIINVGIKAINLIIGLINKFITKFNQMSSKLPSFLTGGKKITIGTIGLISEKETVSAKDTKTSKPKTSIISSIKETFSDISKKIKNFKLPNFKMPTIDTSKPKNIFFDLAKGLDDFNNKSKKTQEQIDKVNKKIVSFVEAVQSQANSIMDLGGLFEKVVAKKFSGEKLKQAVQSQIASLDEWKQSLKNIGSRIGENSNLYLKLLSMGPEYAGQVKALAGMEDKKLGEYMQLFEQKRGLSYELGYKMEAGKEMTNIQNQQMIFNITGNTIKEDLDIDLIANKIIQKLKISGVY